jgi:hypothetical protein
VPITENNHNVYILGAGFSREAGLPLIRDFLHEMRDSVEWLEAQGGARQREIDAIGRVLEFRREAAAASDRINLDVENIEELFSLASALPGREAEDVVTAMAATLDYCRERSLGKHRHFTPNHLPLDFTLPPAWIDPAQAALPVERGTWRTGEQRPVHEWYAGILSGRLVQTDANMRNTVITLNYDTVLEDALWAIEQRFQYGFLTSPQYARDGLCDQTSEFKILKLHGSINWGTSPNDNTTVTVYPKYEALRGAGARPVIVPPTWRKEFGGLLVQVWESAVREIARATRIIVLGFSIPSTDAHFKYLLAAGLRTNISLRKVLFINPDAGNADMLGRLHEIFRSRLMERTVMPIPLKTEDFFTREASFRDLGRRLDKGLQATVGGDRHFARGWW